MTSNTASKEAPKSSPVPLIDAADKDHGTEKTPTEGHEVPEAVHNTIMDLHLELIFMYHRVCLKLANLVSGSGGHVKDGSAKGQNRIASASTAERKSVSCGS